MSENDAAGRQPERDASGASAFHSKFEQDINEGRIRISPDGEPYTVTSWATVDLEDVKAGRRVRPDPAYLVRRDGHALVYPGLAHTFYGASESLKSWAALLACKSALDAGFTALYIDAEADEIEFVSRARVVGIVDGAIGRSLRYIRPDEPLKGNASAISDLLIEETELRPVLVVIDGVSELYALHGWDVNRATDAALFQQLFGKFADGTAMIAIDHAGKDASRGVLGSQHKRAGTWVEYEFTAQRREGKGGHSEARIKVTKDRPGSVRGFAPRDGNIGRIHVAERVYIDAPDSYEAAFGDDAPLYVAILKHIEANPGQSTRAIEQAVGAGPATRRALEGLETEDRIRHIDGPRKAKLWSVTA